jgi:hypothetical protein
MENYEIIYNYLKTFPSDMTVGQLIDNIDKAVNMYQPQREETLKSFFKRFVGKAYYYDEVDDDVVICRYYILTKDIIVNNGNVEFYCELLTVNDDCLRCDFWEKVDLHSILAATPITKERFQRVKKNIEEAMSSYKF